MENNTLKPSFCVYTAVFGGKDIILPPRGANPGVDFVAFTDEPRLPSPWQINSSSVPDGLSPALKNRRLKFLGYREAGQCDISIYMDGSIRVIGDLRPLVDEFIASGAAIGLLRHPHRANIVDEADACVRLRKVKGEDGVRTLRAQVDSYFAEGLPENHGLTENGVLFRRNDHPELPPAMSLWWDELTRHSQRDQISLPYVLWKTGIQTHVWDFSVREPNPFFSLHSHRREREFDNAHIYFRARRGDSIPHFAAFAAIRSLDLVRKGIGRIRRHFLPVRG